MKQVTGYLADDGTYFQTKSEAARHDAITLIQQWCESHKVNNTDVVFQIIHALAIEIRSYINADEECENSNCDAFHPSQRLPSNPELEAHSTDDGERED